MGFNSNYRRAKESILVAKSDAGLPVGGTALVDTAGNCNLADGQLGIFNAEDNTALTAGDTKADAPNIFIAQGTGNNGTGNYLNFPRIFERGQTINGSKIVAYKGQSYAAPALEAWGIGATTAASDAINLADGNRYSVRIAFRGNRQEERVGTEAVSNITVNFTADFDKISGTTDAAKTDYIVQSFVSKINKHSRLSSNPRGRLNVLAFAIDTAATTATSGSVAISGITAGTTAINGITITAEMEAALDALASDTDNDVTSSSLLVPVDLSTAGDSVPTATTDFIALIALDELVVNDSPNEDRVMSVATRLEVGLGGDFGNNVGLFNSQNATEGSGIARKWRIKYRGTMAQRWDGTNRSWLPLDTLDSDLPVVAGETYDVYTIVHNTDINVASDNIAEVPAQEIILVPSGDTATTAALEAVLNPYLVDAGFSAVNL